MAIKFLCPNGHQLSCGDERAGKPGKCPKCGTKFMVPDAAEVAAAASNGAAQSSQSSHAEAAAVGGSAKQGGAAAGPPGSGKSTAVTPGSPSGVGAAGGMPADLIVFLCPNGHRLNGPKTLQGKPGQCPHCGEKFRIPVYEDEPAPEPFEPSRDDAEADEFPAYELPEDEEDIPVGTAVESDPNAESEAVETFPEATSIVQDYAEVVGAFPPLPPGPSHPLFDVFDRLWSVKPEEAAVELILKDGQVLVPVTYSPALSRQAFGVFATRQEDGLYRLVALRWEDIVRIEFQRVKELPAGVFSEH